MESEALSLEELAAFTRAVVANSPSNRLAHIDGRPVFDTPMVGVADGDDPLFTRYKDIIGSHHLTPREVLSSLVPRYAQGAPVTIRVLCWVLPISARTKQDNAAMTKEPSQSWAHTRHYGELFNNELRAEVELYVRERGGTAVAPATSPLFRTARDMPGGPSSTWSERHALYAAGLGTFGLCDGFLTPVGKAMRCGSIVTDVPLRVTPRRYHSRTEACAYLERGTCGVCMARCPVGAIGPSGHDKNACAHYQDETLHPLRDAYGVPITGCGLCQTGVPCESELPA